MRQRSGMVESGCVLDDWGQMLLQEIPLNLGHVHDLKVHGRVSPPSVSLDIVSIFLNRPYQQHAEQRLLPRWESFRELLEFGRKLLDVLFLDIRNCHLVDPFFYGHSPVGT
jgi:hypothetical protein